MQITATLFAVLAPPSGGLSLLLRVGGQPRPPAYVPAGPLAAQLAQAAAAGEVWTLTLADDGVTVVAAAYTPKEHAL